MLLSLSFSNPISLIVSFIIVLILIADIVAGYKTGFLESGVKFLKTIIAMLVAYFVKAPLSEYMYVNLPFFQFDGIFKGVSAISILLYELIAFFVVFILIIAILNIISNVLGLERRILRLVSFIGVPNKIMGAIIGGLKSLVMLYFLLSALFVGSSIYGFNVRDSIGDYIVELPILNNTFGNVLDSFEEIGVLAKEYENTQDKDSLNNKSIDILLDYGIITKDNLNVLIESGKVQYSVNDVDEQKEMVDDLNEILN